MDSALRFQRSQAFCRFREADLFFGPQCPQDEFIFACSLLFPPKEMEYVMGSKTFVKGFEYGLEGCCIGEERTIIIPPHLAYGERGHPPHIPPNAALKFHLKVLDIVAHDLDAQRRGHRDVLPFSEGLVAFLGVVFVVSVMIWRRLRLSRANATAAREAAEKEVEEPSKRTERASPNASVSSPPGSERGGRRRLRARME